MQTYFKTLLRVYVVFVNGRSHVASQDISNAKVLSLSVGSWASHVTFYFMLRIRAGFCFTILNLNQDTIF